MNKRKTGNQVKTRKNAVDPMSQLPSAVALHQQGKFVEAEAIYRSVLAAVPKQPDALHLLGLIEKQKGRLDEAIRLMEEAAKLSPESPAVHSNLGNAYRDKGFIDRAIRCYEEALRLQPVFPDCLNNYGNALKDIGDFSGAVEKYQAALAQQPDYADGHNNIGGAYHKLGRLGEAVQHFERALVLKPGYAMAYYNLGNVLVDLGDLPKAIEHFRASIQSDPNYVEAYNSLLRQLQTTCDWRDIAALEQKLHEFGTETGKGTVFPFAFVAIPGSSSDHQQCARLWASHQYRPYREYAAQHPFSFAGRQHSRIRIGYLSSDFHNHATAYLMAEVFELHDRDKFEVYAFSLGSDDGKDMRRRLMKGFEHFIDLRGKTFHEIAQRIHAEEIDILVDLKGYTKDTGSPVLAFRPAPIQVNHLGYPGTMGADFVDYILTDRFVTPPEEAPYYDEQFAYLPDCYQPNDRQRKIAPVPSRAECGLPEGAIVFCCFNHNYKLTSVMFDAWCRMLKAVPGSVLWLLKSNHWAQENLKREASERGIDPERILFAGEQSLDAHLARLQLADIFLDTLPYNAHTTASDALWACVPVVTLAGETFPSRVAGSLLKAAGLPQLITYTLADYDALGIRLAQRPKELAAIKQHLRENRLNLPLFDSLKFTRNIEALFEQMWDKHRAGQAPAQIESNVSALVASSADSAPLTINIVHIWHDKHKPIFEPLIAQMEGALRDNNISFSRTENVLVDGAINLLVGSTIFITDKLREETKGKHYIVYQMEQLADRNGGFRARPNYLALLKEADWVWDYSATNVAALKQQGVTRISHVPVGFHGVLEHFSHEQPKDIDVLFYGSLTERRQRVVDELRRRGVNVQTSFAQYGKTLDGLIERSKIILNAHQFDNVDILEEVRLSYLLANHCFVVSENSDHNPYSAGVVFCAYDKLADTCIEYLEKSQEQRQLIVEQGYQAIKNLDYSEIINKTLGRMAESLRNYPRPKAVRSRSLVEVPSVNIVQISIDDHKAIFEDLIVALQGALTDLGIVCTRTENTFVNSSLNLLIGAVVFASDVVLDALKGKSYILYQMEQLAADQGFLPRFPKYAELMQGAKYIWDYSRTNISRLEDMGIHGALHVPVGYHSNLEMLRQDDQKDIDVLFYGTLSPRREAILKQLAGHGLNVKAAFGVYGEARNSLIERSKIVLNVHCRDIDILEEVRLSYLLANRCFIISEISDHNPYGEGVIFRPYDQLADTCLEYLQSGDEVRCKIADKGYHAVRCIDFKESILNALTQMGDIQISKKEPVTMQQTTEAPSQMYYSHPRPEVANLVPITATTILDIGCGAGMLGKSIKDRQPCHVTGIELMPDIANYAATLLDKVLPGDVFKALPMLPDAHFDAIIMADVLEHVADTDGMLQLVRQKLKPDGKVIISLPNVRHWSVVKGLLEGRWEYQAQGILDRTHLKFFTRSSAIQTLQRNGFNVEKVSAIIMQMHEMPPEGLGAVLKTFGIEALDLDDAARHFQYLYVCSRSAA